MSEKYKCIFLNIFDSVTSYGFVETVLFQFSRLNGNTAISGVPASILKSSSFQVIYPGNCMASSYVSVSTIAENKENLFSKKN
jgi:hypothetical protein